MADNKFSHKFKAARRYLRERKIESLQKLLESGFPVNVPFNELNRTREFNGHPNMGPMLFNFINIITTSSNNLINKIDYDIVELLLKYKANVNYVNFFKNDILSLMCAHNLLSDWSVPIIKLILDNKANVNNPSVKIPAINHVLNKLHPPVDEILLKQSAKIDHVKLRISVIKILLEHGAIVNNILSDQFGNYIMCEKNSSTLRDIIEAIEENELIKFKDNLVLFCNIGCRHDIIKNLLRWHVDIDQVYNVTPYSLVFKNYHKYVPFFHSPNSYNVDNQYDLTLFQLTVLNINVTKFLNNRLFNNYIDIAEILLDFGADIDIKNGTHLTKTTERQIDLLKCHLNVILTEIFPNVLVDIIISYTRFGKSKFYSQ
jgi:hypothetical protein